MKDETMAEKDESELADLREAMRMKGIKLIRGWKPIRDALGLKCSIQTVRRLARRFRMPVAYLCRKPTILDAMLNFWWLNIQEIALRKQRKSDTP
jgi:hypothetical protein